MVPPVAFYLGLDFYGLGFKSVGTEVGKAKNKSPSIWERVKIHSGSADLFLCSDYLEKVSKNK